jgi:thiamine pyrophosphate-dependent acetolactate synthase large subunit-like protein
MAEQFFPLFAQADGLLAVGCRFSQLTTGSWTLKPPPIAQTALGAKAVHPNRKVVAVVGDGGLQMSALELATAVQEKLATVVLPIYDECLTLIKATQERRYSGRYIAVDLKNPDFELLARAFGVRYWRADDEAALECALREALATDVPALVEVRAQMQGP